MALSDLEWIPSHDQPIPAGEPGETLWVKLGWAAFEWTWHPTPGVWAAADWSATSERESVSPGAHRRNLKWARPV